MARSTDLNVEVDADVARFEAGVGRAFTALRRLEGQLERADRATKGLDKQLDGQAAEAARKRAAAMQRLGRGMTAFGAATVAGLGLAVKAAIDWESSWTGVLKTVDGTPEQLARVEQGLRDLATTLPASHQEIAAVAEAAGQLGVATDDVVDFTRTMIDLGETTNLTAEEAAVQLSRFANIMGTSTDDVDRLGASIVGLGNSYETTEAEIVAMSMRLAGAGQQASLTEGDVFGLATAMSSVGIQAEAGGTAMSKTMKRIGKAVDEGGDSLDLFAEVSGMSSQQFAAAWRDDAAAALAVFIGGLGETESLGMSTNAVLEELGITGEREADTLLRLSSAQDLLTDALKTGNEEYRKNTALIEEAAKRYDTAEAKLQIAKNGIVDAGISIGENFLPVVADAAEGIADLAKWFADLPAPVQNTVGALGAAAGALSLAGGGFLMLAPGLRDTLGMFKDLRATSPGAATGLRRVGRAAGMAGGAALGFAVLTNAVEAFDRSDSASSVAETTEALLAMQSGLGNLDELFSGLGLGIDKVDGLEDALRRVADPNLADRVQDIGGKVRDLFGGEGNTARTEVVEQLDAVGQSLASLVQGGHAELAADLWDEIAQKWEAAGGSLEELEELMPTYRDALLDVENAEVVAAEGAGKVATELEGIDPAAEQAAAELEEFEERASAAFASFIDPAGAFQAAIDKNTEFAEEAAEATEDAEDSWEDFYDGQSVSAGEYIKQLRKQVEAQENWRDNMISLSEKVNEGMTGEMRQAGNDMIEELMDLGPEGAAQVELLEGMTDKQLRKVVRLFQRKGEDASNEFTDEINDTKPDPVKVDADTRNANRKLREARRVALRIPRSRTTSTRADNVSSYQRAMRAARADALRIPRSMSTTLYQNTVKRTYIQEARYGQRPMALGGMVGLAGGGRVPGTPPAHPMVDNVPAINLTTGRRIALRSGEWVHSQPAVDYYGPAIMAALNERRVPKELLTGLNAGGPVPGLAAGGPVPRSSTPADTGPRVVINATSHYPQAEPESQTINRGLQIAAALGVGEA